MKILNLLATSNFLVINKELIRKIGIEETVLLTELISESEYWSENTDWFFSTIENVETNTTLNDYSQRKIIKRLINLGLIEIKKEGIPCKRYIRIVEEKIVELLQNKNLKNSKTSVEKIKELDVKNLKNLYNNNNINNNNNNIYIGEVFKNKEVAELFLKFIQHRKEKKKPLTKSSIEFNIKKLNKYTDSQKIYMLTRTLENGWQGIIEEDLKNMPKEVADIEDYLRDYTEENNEF